MKQLRNTAAGFLILIIALAFFGDIFNRQKFTEAAKKMEIRARNAFSGMNLTAKASYVYDISRKKILYEENADLTLPIASLTKLMTALTALSEAPRKTIVTISKKSLGKEGDTGLLSDERWTLDSLIKFTLLTSSNDGAAAIAGALGASGEGEFVKKMNTRAKESGFEDVYFANETGLDENSDSAGAYASAKWVARIMEEFIVKYPDILEATAYSLVIFHSEDEKAHNAENTNKTVEKIPGIIASKTGFTDIAGGSLAIAFDAGLGQPIIIVVLGGTLNGRFSDVLELSERTREAIHLGL
ncbi:MAG: hypothetical protein AAB355_02840 [Patescibacteria group bacterium]